MLRASMYDFWMYAYYKEMQITVNELLSLTLQFIISTV